MKWMCCVHWSGNKHGVNMVCSLIRCYLAAGLMSFLEESCSMSIQIIVPTFQLNVHFTRSRNRGLFAIDLSAVFCTFTYMVNDDVSGTTVTLITDHSFCYASTCLWNQLPLSLRQPYSGTSSSISDTPVPSLNPSLLSLLIHHSAHLYNSLSFSLPA